MNTIAHFGQAGPGIELHKLAFAIHFGRSNNHVGWLSPITAPKARR